MISIYDIKGWSDLAAFLIWTLAVCAIAKALFGSLLAAELQYRLSLRDAPRRQRMNRLNWEINNRTVWSEEVVRRSPHAAKQPISDSDIESRRRELQQLARTSLAQRAVTYFMGCFACQTFWVAAFTFLLTSATSTISSCVLTSAACSGLSSLLRAPLSRLTTELGTPPASRPGCKSCGQ